MELKRARVVMLRAKNEAYIHKQVEGNLTYRNPPEKEHRYTEAYHLYVLSEEKLREEIGIITNTAKV